MSTTKPEPRLQVPLRGAPRTALADLAAAKQWSEAQAAVYLLTQALKKRRTK